MVYISTKEVLHTELGPLTEMCHLKRPAGCFQMDDSLYLNFDR